MSAPARALVLLFIAVAAGLGAQGPPPPAATTARPKAVRLGKADGYTATARLLHVDDERFNPFYLRVEIRGSDLFNLRRLGLETDVVISLLASAERVLRFELKSKRLARLLEWLVPRVPDSD
jgi:hypothetical protein